MSFMQYLQRVQTRTKPGIKGRYLSILRFTDTAKNKKVILQALCPNIASDRYNNVVVVNSDGPLRRFPLPDLTLTPNPNPN